MYKNDDKVVCINAKDCPELVEGNVYNVNWFDGKYWLYILMSLGEYQEYPENKGFNHERFKPYVEDTAKEDSNEFVVDEHYQSRTYHLWTSDEFVETSELGAHTDTKTWTKPVQYNKGDKVISLADGNTYKKVPNNKYAREIKPGVFVDVYDVIYAFTVNDPCIQHAIKKLLAAGERGHKDRLEDLEDIVASVNRAIEMHKEWENK